MSAVVTGGPATSSVTVTGPGGTGPVTVDTTVAGLTTRVVLLDHGVTTPPTGTRAGSVLIQKG